MRFGCTSAVWVVARSRVQSRVNSCDICAGINYFRARFSCDTLTFSFCLLSHK